MSEITVIALFNALPERRGELKAALVAMAEATHREPGCLLYALQEGVNDPNDLAFIEKWESQEALDKHGTMPHLRDGADERAAMMAEPARVVFMRNAGAGDPQLGTL